MTRSAWMCAVLVVVSSATAQADAAGDAALAKVDAALTRAKTTYFEYEARTVEGAKQTTAAMNVWAKGEKRLIEFLAPADMKGTKVLVLSPSEIYVYLPAFGKVRRIASSTQDQGFLGMAFTTEDLATTTYGPRYDAKVAKSGDKELVLALTAKAGKTGAPVELTVDVAKQLPTTVTWSGADGKVTRTETLGGYTCEATVCSAGTRVMTTAKAATTLTRKKWKVNEAISDDVFSKRNLER